jgi:hypothetical protein
MQPIPTDHVTRTYAIQTAVERQMANGMDCFVVASFSRQTGRDIAYINDALPSELRTRLSDDHAFQASNVAFFGRHFEISINDTAHNVRPMA